MALVKSKERERKTLIQLTNETKTRDPGAFAKQQVLQLDKNAKNAETKRRMYQTQLQHDQDELSHLQAQIADIERQ